MIVVVVSVDGWIDGWMDVWVGLRRRGSGYSNSSIIRCLVRRTMPCELKALHELSLALYL